MSSFEEKSKITVHVELTISGVFVFGYFAAIIDQNWLGLPLVVFLIIGFINVVRTVLALLCLYKGIEQKDLKKLKIWLIFAAVFWILDALGAFISCFNIQMFTLGYIFLDIAFLVYRGLTMWIVFKFFQEIKQDDPQMDKTNGGINF